MSNCADSFDRLYNMTTDLIGAFRKVIAGEKWLSDIWFEKKELEF